MSGRCEKVLFMDATAQAELFREFPVTAEKTPRSFLAQYIEATIQHRALVPLPFVADALGLSKQRVHQLISGGQLASIEIGDRKFVPASALELFLTEERKTGVHLSRRWIYFGGGEPLKKRS
jgi:hypothetical protein